MQSYEPTKAEEVTVTQEDREAAASIIQNHVLALYPDIGAKTATLTRDGKRDKSGYVQAFARHRTQAEARGFQRGFQRGIERGS